MVFSTLLPSTISASSLPVSASPLILRRPACVRISARRSFLHPAPVPDDHLTRLVALVRRIWPPPRAPLAPRVDPPGAACDVFAAAADAFAGAASEMISKDAMMSRGRAFISSPLLSGRSSRSHLNGGPRSRLRSRHETHSHRRCGRKPCMGCTHRENGRHQQGSGLVRWPRFDGWVTSPIVFPVGSGRSPRRVALSSLAPLPGAGVPAPR